jgi:uncharacterized GH25 family protein
MKILRHVGWPALLAMAATSPAAAHDFWLQPGGFWLDPNARMPLTLQVGHGHSRQRSPIALHRITRFEAIAPDGTTVDLRGSLQRREASDGNLRFERGGTYMLVLETDDRAQSHLPADRFNAHLEAEGLTPAIEHRALTHRTNAPGAEKYRRLAKAIVQVGHYGGPSEPITRALGLPLEILLEQSPYADPRPSSLPVRIIYEGAPLAGARVRLTNLAQDESPAETQLTDSEGRVGFAMPGPGSWLLSVVWTKKLPETDEVDFDTIFSSLSFGVPKAGP